MVGTVTRAELTVASELAEFLEKKALPGTGVETGLFWQGLSDLIHEMGPKNRALLEKRAELQAQISAWHRANPGPVQNMAEYRSFLKDIGYLVPEGPDFSIETADVDPEIAEIPGAQLVVPVMNARYALNAANARWGSLYDALYGTDALGSLPPAGPFSKARGAEVLAWAKDFLDDVVPLSSGSWADLEDVSTVAEQLIKPSQYAGTTRDGILLKNHGLHILIRVDRNSAIGKTDPAGISDVILESAMSAIMD